ncbi:peroxin [Thelonectria olida]|uniref:Peroxin n=1 Tax=Thelonectria olida TaxID=1576542 RepID=A0A9P8WGY7_9HYPO|nr:peroxin [Thelonectria olida]
MAEEFSDPDEDDLDDLDGKLRATSRYINLCLQPLSDMLDDFSTVNLDSQKSPVAPSAHKSEAPKAAPSGKLPELDEFSEEEFAKQLQAGMADLLGEMEKSAQFEDMFKQIAASEGISDPAAPSTSAKPAPPPSAEDASFQETIRRTMERLQGSGEQATAAAASGGADDFMSEMLKQLGSGDLGALGGEENEEDFSKILMGMMEQLTNKEILYEPMKELDQKFPGWLAKNRSTTPKEDLKRYEEQRTVVREIVAKFEERTYSDSNAADREFIVDRMQKMQAAGSPPADLVGDMPSAQEALNPTDESCNPQ